MDIPNHPLVDASIGKGRDFISRLDHSQHAIETTKVVAECPDGDNTIVFDGAAMVVEATFTDDVFDRYPRDELADLLLDMCDDGYEKVKRRSDSAVDYAEGLPTELHD
ncbi:YbaB/EbfC family nucleoid-associated protein [Mycobacterium sp. DBP42]|uniref:YbaB/EbfC family nucleoid-associated protein n=1 Tax=Mycobacteriaceae TaxID=1762 RepID=UPI001BB17194|nr:YbaB/EbfC family nucleoid-associated protein [Mycobacterium sp. DBP42]